jgi:hypothetical protein
MIYNKTRVIHDIRNDRNTLIVSSTRKKERKNLCDCYKDILCTQCNFKMLIESPLEEKLIY